MNDEITVRRYRPSNGTEGEGFMGSFCDECQRDAKYRETDDGADGCPILAAALIFNVKDEQYPNEWTYDAEGNPTCTAFLPLGSQLPTDTELEQAGQLTAFDL